MAPTPNAVADVEPGASTATETSTAFTTLYRDHRPRVYAMLRGMLRDPYEAEDATQHVFVKLLESLPQLEERRGGLGAWLNQVCVNHARDRLRRRRFDPAEPNAILARLDADAAATGRWRTDQSTAELVAMLDGLSPLQRRVVFLREVAGMAPAEVAELLETTSGTVRQTHHIALNALRPSPGPDRPVPVRREERLPCRRFVRPRRVAPRGFVMRPRWAGLLG